MMSYSDNSAVPDLKALFSDTTADYVFPVQPDLYKMVRIRLRVRKGDPVTCFLVLDSNASLHMRPVESDGLFTWFEVGFEVTRNPLRYYFVVVADGRSYRFTRRGLRNTIRPADWWYIVPGFHTPAWAEGAVMYQIFVDRFCNGDRTNDVFTGEYPYMGRPVLAVEDWDRPPSSEGYREFYGGDLQGVIEKLDYLQDLGVEAIYFNPIFLSPSSHKYDTQDYEHIDPHFGRIVRDGARKTGRPVRNTASRLREAAKRVQEGEKRTGKTGNSLRNAAKRVQEEKQTGKAGYSVRDAEKQLQKKDAGRGKAGRGKYPERYLLRVTDPENLAASDRLFARLVKEAHARGIRVILDGVFNHCGSLHRWMDAGRIYERLPGGVKGARFSARSPYTSYFRFRQDEGEAGQKAARGRASRGSYDAWWDFDTLPKLYYENSEELCRYILQIGKKWVSPPYNADGWRLDVAADLGYSRAFNHAFWKRFYRAVKAANPEAVILAENYTDSREWLQGGEWDTIMNYEFFMEPVTWFFTGMEKHSDARNEERYGDPDAFWQTVLHWNQDRVPEASLRIGMNELSNHDHSRFLTRTSRRVGRAQTLGPEAALQGVHMEVMRQAVLLQMTWTGAPTIYYGDEAGLGGFTDPDNRRTYPWGREDHALLDYHRILTGLRRTSPALRHGSLMRLPDGDGILAYARFCRGGTAISGARQAPPVSGIKQVQAPPAVERRYRQASSVSGTDHREPSALEAGMRGGTGPDLSQGAETFLILININYIPIEYEADVVYTGVPAGARLDCLLRTDREGVRTGLPAISVRDGRIRLTLPPESGFLLRWRPDP